MYADQYKVHERGAHRKRQREILDLFAEKFDLRIVETGKFCAHDARMYSRKTGGLRSFTEARHRNMKREWYPSGYWVDEAKIDKLFAVAEAHDVYGIHIVEWLDGEVWYVNVTKALWEEVAPGLWEMADPWERVLWKRRDRDEKPDWMYCMGHSWFKYVGKLRGGYIGNEQRENQSSEGLSG